MKIYLQMEGDKLVKLVPLDQYNAIKREFETQLERTKKAAKLRIERQRKALAALNREIRSSQKRERDAVGEMTNMRIYEGIVQSVRTILKADREEKTEDAAKRVMALGKPFELPTVDGKTPEEIMQSVYYSTPAAEYPFRKAASAVLAVFGGVSLAAAIARMEAVTTAELQEVWYKTNMTGRFEAIRARLIDAAKEAEAINFKSAVSATPGSFAKTCDDTKTGELPVSETPWIEWHGGECPLNNDAQEVEWMLRDSTTHKAHANRFLALEWKHGGGPFDIIAYRVLKWRSGCGPVDWKAKFEELKYQCFDLEQRNKNQREYLEDIGKRLGVDTTDVGFIKATAENMKERAEKAEAELANAKEIIMAMQHVKESGLSQLRPISEAGPVPEGCVRVSGWLEDEKWIISSALWSTDTHFADIQLPAAKSDDSAKPEPETFEAHGKVWTRHTPGDAMPVDTVTLIDVLMDDDIICLEQYVEFASTWSSIIGWRYADAHLVTPNATECGQCADKSNFQLAPGEG